MSNMKERFTRSYKVLELMWETISEGDQTLLITEEQKIDSRWLRNEAGLWVDYKEDSNWLLNGTACDPNHPDNLSTIVITHFIGIKQLYIKGVVGNE